MSIVHLSPHTSKRTSGTMRELIKRKTQKRKELLFGLAVTAIILAAATISAFNGGLSLEAGRLAMTINASWTEGMQLSFASL